MRQRELLHTRRTCFRPNSPCGFTSRTISSTAKAIGSRSSEVAKPTYWPIRLRKTPSSEAADHGARRALEPAEHGGGERVEQDRLHHRRLQEHRRLRHQPGHGAEHCGEAPADREHAVHAHADERRRRRPQRGGAHRQPELRELEQHPEQQHRDDRDQQRADVLARERDAAEVVDGVAERRRHELEVGAPLPGDEPVDQDEQADGDDHDGDHRVLHGADQRRLDDRAEEEGDDQREEERPPVGDVPEGQLVGEVRRRHRHLALGEVDHLGGAVDEHERERQAGEDRALRQSGHRLLREDRAEQRADEQEDRRRRRARARPWARRRCRCGRRGVRGS